MDLYVSGFSEVVFLIRDSANVHKLSELYAGTGEVCFACHMRADLGVPYPAAFAVRTVVRAE